MNIPLNVDWQQILLHLFNFGILTGGLYLLLYKPIKDFMDKRAAYYKDLEDKAQAKLTEAENVKAQYDEKLAGADEEIAVKKKETMAKVNDEAEKQLQDAKVQAEKYMQNAREDMAREHDRILEESKKEVAELAVEATRKLLAQTAKDPYESFLQNVDGGAADEH